MAYFVFQLVFLFFVVRYLFFQSKKPEAPVTQDDQAQETEKLAEIDGGTWKQTSVFEHVERGLKKNPDGPAVVCLFKQAESLRKLVASSGADRYNEASQDPVQSLWRKEQSTPPEKKTPPTSPKKTDPNTFTMSYMQLHLTALRLAAGLVSHGAQSNSNMLMLIPNGGEYTILLWVCILLRITYVSIDPSSLEITGFTALKHTLRTIKPQIVVVPDALSGRAIDVGMSELGLPQPIRLCLFDSDSVSSPKGWRSLNAIANSNKDSRAMEVSIELAARQDRDPKRINSIMFTSGTSGLPKGCPQSVSAISYALHSQEWLLDSESGASDYALMQPHNSRGIAPAQTLQTWRAGGAVVLTGQNFNVKDAINAIKQVGATFFVLTPPMVHEFGVQMAAEPLDVSCVKRIQIGGDAVTKDVLVKCAALFPRTQVCVNHGMTEGPGVFLWPFLDVSPEKIPFLGGQICPIGVVAPGAKVRICDVSRPYGKGEPKRAVKRGHLGELHISCPSVIKSYLNGRSDESFYNDGKGRWFNTGDMAMIDGNGLLYIVGRRKDMIKCAGVTVAPAVIESCIAAFTKTQTVVVPAPHRVLGAEPFAVVDTSKMATNEQIKDHIRAILGRDYALGGVVELKQLGLVDFPVNATHKIIKTDIQSAVARYLQKAKK
ncbi:putative amp dependent CoA ligase [Aaosphaeria arxii CBS 175.79]|uniref:Putative amp dependent CoA ligase n=1 Tax=Aaosphaeria arxii CBS 175.79 TaxID=1450172 RepID=A0A6A5XVQ2_9PLEO|nr:putative amp dependent CoA ligase [Aaosphaeria arxii CBS 175.79]KAF2017039.1 putative amp dependent CoA ligase [Aaosphaeria arxii CBS 175.79]